MAKAKTASSADGKKLAARARTTKAALRARAEELLAKAVALKARIERDFWDLGATLRALRQDGLHAALGFERLEDLAAERLGLARTTAWKLMAVAEQVPRAEALKLGQEKAYALIQYARATPEDDTAAALAATDGPIAGKPLSEVSVRELAAARPKPPPSLADREQGKADKALVTGVHARLGPVGVPKAAITVVGDEVVIRLSRKQAARLAK